ncbi:hypothetical protein CPB86DRAFT_876508 [Serendipita vermifera]|nr:hypothetical protein CPB86DRAFT_876508 [Serendipita vermifera]
MFGSLSTKIAHSAITPGLGNQDLKPLQETINKEKEIVTSAQRLSRDLTVGSEALKQWGAGEGEDLSDLWHSAMLLTSHLSTALNTFADHQLNIRAQLKDVRTKEEQLDELRRRRKTVAGKLDAQEKRLSKMGPENKSLSLATEQLTSLQNELRQLDSSILIDMARLSDHKRTVSHSVMVLKFGGLLELGEKFTIIGELGKLLANEVPQEQTQPGQGRAPYFGREVASNLVAEAARCVSEVVFNPNAGSGQRPRPQRLSVQRPAGYPEGTGEGSSTPLRSSVDAPEGSSRFTDKPSTSYLPQHQGSASLSSAARGTMPPNREYGAPLDEFGRPLDGLPPQSNTMPPLRKSGGSPPVQQLPLSAIQQSMRHPDAGMPPPGQSGFRPPPQDGRSGFRAPGPPPTLTGPPQQRIQPPYNQPGMPQYPPKQGGATVERGLTLSLPIRSPAPPEADENDDPRAAPHQSNAGPSGSRRQGTVDEDAALANEIDLKRTSTLPPKIGVGIGDFPEWSLGLGELGLGGSPIKELPEPKDEGSTTAAAAPPSPAIRDEQDTPPPPAKGETVSSDNQSLALLSAVPRDLRSETGSASQTPITETPTSYSKTQTPTGGTPTTATNPENVVIHHLVDDPSTRTGSSGRFAMFPDKRKQTTQQGSGGESLLLPNPKYTAHPGMDRTPSPYPDAGMMAGASPIPTPREEKQSDPLPLNVGALVSPTPSNTGPPRLELSYSEQQPKSILLDSSTSRSGTMESGAPISATGEGPPRLRFAPRPASPVTPSPVTPGWGSQISLDSGGVGPIGSSPSQKPPTNRQEDETRGAELDRKDSNRLSVITPLGIHKHRESGSQPSLASPKILPNDEDVSEEKFRQMLDSFSADLGSPNTSSSQSGIHHRQDTSFYSGPDTSLSSAGPGASEQQRGGPVGGDDLRFAAPRNDQDSSLDTTAAAAGSPFPSTNPPNLNPATPSRQIPQQDANRPGAGVPGGYAAGTSPGYKSELAYRRGSDSEDSEDSAPGKTIAAGAFKRKGGGLPSHPAVGRVNREGASGSGSYQQHYSQSSNPTNVPPMSDMTPRMNQRSVSPPTQMGRYPSDQPSVYQTPQSTPQGIPNDMVALPPGAAAPTRVGVPSPTGSPRWSGSQSGHLQGRASPGPSLKNDRIPPSLMPGRPGSAAPLAPIGHTQASPISSPGGGRGMYYGGGGPNMGPGNGYGPPSATSSQGYGVPPWQQQPQYGHPQQRGPSPLMGEFDGSMGMQAAYGGGRGLANDSPYAAAAAPGRGGYGGPAGYPGGNRQGY